MTSVSRWCPLMSIDGPLMVHFRYVLSHHCQYHLYASFHEFYELESSPAPRYDPRLMSLLLQTQPATQHDPVLIPLLLQLHPAPWHDPCNYTLLLSMILATTHCSSVWSLQLHHAHQYDPCNYTLLISRIPATTLCSSAVSAWSLFAFDMLYCLIVELSLNYKLLV